MNRLTALRVSGLLMAATARAPAQEAGPAEPVPGLDDVSSARVELSAPVEQDVIDGQRVRFIPIRGGSVSGPAPRRAGPARVDAPDLVRRPRHPWARPRRGRFPRGPVPFGHPQRHSPQAGAPA